MKCKHDTMPWRAEIATVAVRDKLAPAADCFIIWCHGLSHATPKSASFAAPPLPTLGNWSGTA